MNMKAFRSLIAVASLAALFVLSGCPGSKNNPESTQDKQFGLLSKTWKVSSVSLGGVDKTGEWTGFQLAISGTKGATSFSYSCTSRPTLSPWKASGTWAFGTNPVTQIVRDGGTADEQAITYTVDATGANLELDFSYSGSGYTRVGVVSGNWVFKLTSN